MIDKRELLLALTDKAHAPLGSMWRLTAKKTDFYIDFIGTNEVGLHLSVHGPNERFDGHRFHIKTDRRKVKQAQDAGYFMDPKLHKGAIHLDVDGLVREGWADSIIRLYIPHNIACH